MNEHNVENQNYDFSTSAKIKRFLRANKKNFISLAICLGILIILFCFIIIPAVTDSDDYLTYENFEKIQNEMDYQDVVDVLKHLEDSKSSGREDCICIWKDGSGSRWISVRFDKNGIVCHKEQKGLD